MLAPGADPMTREVARARRARAWTVAGVLALAFTAALTASALGGPSPACTNEIVGTERADTLRGTSGSDLIRGLGGDDRLTGLAAGDCLVGGDGDDELSGGRGDYTGNDGGDVLLGGAGDDLLRGEAGDDRLEGGSGLDTLFGGRGDDELVGGAGDDLLAGGDGDDRLDGGSGADVIDAGTGLNRIDGGEGGDDISSWNGRRETVRCGPGTDRVLADRADRLVGCERIRRARPLPVRPAIGRARTVFTVRFKARFSVVEPANQGYAVRVSAPRGSSCRDGTLRTENRVRRGRTLVARITFEPGPAGAPRSWCRGLWLGEVRFESANTSGDCARGGLPPEDCSTAVPVGYFSFRIRG